MQIEPSRSNTAIKSASESVANDSISVTSLSLSTSAESNNDRTKPRNVLKHPITPIGGKSNLLKLLNGSKSAAFKTIGDRIVVPMKVNASSKSTNRRTDSNSKSAPQTFQMAIPANSASFKLGNESVKTSPPIKNSSLGPSPSPKVAATKKVIIKREITDFDTEPVGGDLNKFMSTVTRNVFFPIKSDDRIAMGRPEIEKNPKDCFVGPKLELLEPDLNQEDDGDLTCLSWLSSDNKELLRTIRKCNPDDPGIGLSGDEADDIKESNKLIFTASSRVSPQNSSSNNVSNDFMYNPLSKPPYSFSCLIFMAIEDSYLKRLPVKDIYNWVCKHFPYYRSAPSGWKNSIRHNLSLNRCFKKAEIRKDCAKGSLWCIDPAYRPNLVQALKRSPFYPYLHPTGVGQPLSLHNLANLLPCTYTGRIPSWTPALPPSTLWADPDMASAALNLMGLRKDEVTSNNTELISSTLEEIFREADWLNDTGRVRERRDSAESVGTELVVIRGVTEDHTYSLVPSSSKKKPKRDEKRCKSPESDKSAPDAAYEFESAEFSDDEINDVITDGVVVECPDSDADVEEPSLFDSGFGSMKSFAIKCEPEASVGRRKRARVEVQSPVRKSARNAKRAKSKAVKSNVEVQKGGKQRRRGLAVSLKQTKAKTKATSYKAGSDVDSGKDSPKIERAGRGRRVRPRSYRKSNQSTYHTRSSRYKLLGQMEPSPKRSSRRKRTQSYLTNDDEEVKLAAGSLMRLAGLLKSPCKLDFN